MTRAEGSLADLATLPGLETVAAQLASVLAVARAEQARQAAGAAIVRPAWKNLVFTGGPGSGRSRAAAAMARAYRELGVLSSGHLTEVASQDLATTDVQLTGRLVREAAGRGRGGVLMITNVHEYSLLHDRGALVLRNLYTALTDFRATVAVILAGDAEPLHELLATYPALAARFPAVIDFPAYTPGQLAAVFTTLAGEAGFTLTAGAGRRAADVLGRAARGPDGTSARLAVQLLDQATARQARRVDGTTALGPAALCTLRAADIPDELGTAADEGARRDDGRYL
jgi:hypothetical protein